MTEQYGYLLSRDEAEALKKRVSAMDDENRRLRAALALANAQACDLERDKQQLARMWQEEHTERIALEERLKMAEIELQIYQEA